MILYVLTIIIVALLFILYATQQTYHRHIQHLTNSYHDQILDLMDSWQDERSELLDRIQAPTFGEYKQAKIRMVKAQKEEEPKPSFILE